METNLATDDSDQATTGYRSGVAARLAGLPAETLRVWERRYGVSEAQRSPQGQRLYSAQQVRRLALLKRVVDLGHAIGTVARLPADELAALAGAVETGPAVLRLAVAGAVLAQRLASVRTTPALELVASCAQLDGAAAALDAVEADVLLIDVPEMAADALPQVLSVRRAVRARATVVLYRFCDSATVRRLREQGCMVARAPADPAEVAQLCAGALGRPADAAPLQRPALRSAPCAPGEPGATTLPAVPTPPRLDQQALAALSTTATSINCECPRHLADILTLLGSFERYSQGCATRDTADALLHQDLGRSAGQARMLIEQALFRLAEAEGLPLTAVPGSGA